MFTDMGQSNFLGLLGRTQSWKLFFKLHNEFFNLKWQAICLPSR